MAKAKTGSFYLTETVAFSPADPASTRVQGEIDLGAYVSVAQGIAVAIESVDLVYQQTSEYAGGPVATMLAGNGALTVQLTDLNPGSQFVRADNQSLIASGSMNIDTANNVATYVSDIYPDQHYGKGDLNESFMVVNDTLYLVAGNDDAAIGANAVYCTARIKARIVSLSKENWVAIAIQSTASDN